MPGEIRLICKHPEALAVGSEMNRCSQCWKGREAEEQGVKICGAEVVIGALTPWGPLSVLGNSRGTLVLFLSH